MKIYIVTSSEGKWEDYHSWNEKAFISKEKAVEYAKELDKKHYYKPEFITEEFEDLYNEADDIFYQDNPYPEFKDPNHDKLASQWEENQQKFIIQYMQDRGVNITPEMYKEYEEWMIDGKYYSWSDCEIEEIELVE